MVDRVIVGKTVLSLVKDQYLPENPNCAIKGVFKHYSVNYWVAIAYIGAERLEGVGSTPTLAAEALFNRLVVLEGVIHGLI